MIKKLCLFISAFAIPTVAAAFSPVQYVQISTNSLNQQSGGFNVSSGTIGQIIATTATITTETVATSNITTGTVSSLSVSTATLISSETVTNATISNLGVSSMTTTLPMSNRKITGLANGTISTDAMAFGQNHVFQVVFATFTASSATTSGTYVPTNCSITITPTSSSSKILVIAVADLTSTSGFLAYSSIFNNAGTNLATNGSAALAVSGGSASGVFNSSVMMWLDSPATTSAITYTVKLKSSTGGQTSTYGGQTEQTMYAIEMQ